MALRRWAGVAKKSALTYQQAYREGGFFVILHSVMLFGKPKSFLGVDIGAGGVKVVELKSQKMHPVLFTYGYTSESQGIHQMWSPTREATAPRAGLTPRLAEEKKSSLPEIKDEEVDKMAQVLKTVCAQAKTVSKQAVVGLPVSTVFHAVVSLPKVAQKDFLAILKAEVQKLLPYPLEETALDYQILPATKDSKVERVLVNAVPRALVAFYTKVCLKAGLQLVALETEAAALTRSLIGRDASVSMLVDIGAERTNFFIIDNTVPVTYQSIEVGGVKIDTLMARSLGVDAKIAEGLKRDLFSSAALPAFSQSLDRQAFMDLFMSLVEPIAKEIEYGFDVYFRQSGNENKKPEKIVLTGGAARFPFVADYLSQLFKIKCYLADPWGRVVYPDALKPVLHSIGPRLSVALGLALRSMV